VSYARLAHELQATAQQVAAHERQLEGVPLARAAERLEAALRQFRSALDDALRGFAPAVVALRDLLESEGARSRLDAKTLKLLAKKASAKALTLKAADTPADQRKRFLDQAVKLGRAEEAALALRAFLAGAARPSPALDDRDKVLAELWRLGALSEADFEIEQPALLEKPDLLRAMAGYAHVKTTTRTSPKTMLTNLVKFARRVQENTS
jgi:hypothetical protein